MKVTNTFISFKKTAYMLVERKMIIVTVQATRFTGGYDYNELK